MDFSLEETHRLAVEALGHWAEAWGTVDAGTPWLSSDAVIASLAEQGFLAMARPDALGILGGVLLVEAVSRLPQASDIGVRGLIAPVLGISVSDAPVAVVRAALHAPIRFLRPGGSLLVDAGDHVAWMEGAEIEPVESPFAYPFGRLTAPMESKALEWIDLAAFRNLHGLALGAEAVAAMQACLDLTLDHVRTRHQFGQPLGAFQAVQHRLAECATMLHGARLLLYRAAAEEGDAVSLMLRYMREAIRRLIYESNQLHGAIGLTLEYPLHLWSYRLRWLQGEITERLTP